MSSILTSIQILLTNDNLGICLQVAFFVDEKKSATTLLIIEIP